MITEDRVQQIILERVMNRLEGNEEGGGAGEQRSEQQIRLEQERHRIEIARSELQGLTLAIKSMIDHYYSRVEFYSGGGSPVITKDHNEYRTIFSSDIGKLQTLMDAEIEARQGAVEQQA